jgi:transcription elongation factor GreB
VRPTESINYTKCRMHAARVRSLLDCVIGNGQLEYDWGLTASEARCSPWKDYEMRKGFTRKPQADEPATPVKNYITPSGLERLKDEHRFLLTRERPAVTEVVAWAASNGDRSENADYQYGKRRLRQIDGRIRFLTKRIEAAEVVDPEAPRAGQAATRAFFGATVRYANAAGVSRVVSIVGTDEIDLNRNHISWVSPLGRALMKSAAGDSVVLQLPGGTEYLTVMEVRYERIDVEPFRESPGSEASAKGLTRRRYPAGESHPPS